MAGRPRGPEDEAKLGRPAQCSPGNSYSYSLDGDTITYYVPPIGFNLATATPSQLATYNLKYVDELDTLATCPAQFGDVVVASTGIVTENGGGAMN